MKFPFHHDASPKTFEQSRFLKANQTAPEAILWQHLRNRGLEGRKFRRQHAIASFIVDFYCHEERLVIEVDGPTHQDTDAKLYDDGRTYALENLGLQVIRFNNQEVIGNVKLVLKAIALLFKPHPNPSP